MRKWIDGTLLRFLLVGVINTLVGCGTMFLLYNLAHWSYWASSAANYIVGGIVSFFLNKYFTFRKKEWSWKQVIKFAVNVAVCWLLAYGMAKPLVLHLLEGYTLQETAALLRLPLGTVKTILYRALSKLRAEAEEAENNE